MGSSGSAPARRIVLNVLIIDVSVKVVVLTVEQFHPGCAISKSDTDAAGKGVCDALATSQT